MRCPSITDFQSPAKGQKRLDQAIDSLGNDVVHKILGFSLYILGFPYDYISSNVGISEPGLKTFIKDVCQNGVQRFLDKRKKAAYSIPPKDFPVAAPPKTTVEYSDIGENHVQFKLTGPISLRLHKDDIIGKKLLSLLFLDAGLLRQKDVANLLDCRRLSVYKNHQKFNSLGTKGLLDNREGQKRDYKVDSEVKGEIIKEYLLSIFSNEVPTKTTISNSLKERFSKDYSERSVASHLKKLGLTDNKKEFISEIVHHVNERVDSLDYLIIPGWVPEVSNHLEVLKIFRKSTTNCVELLRHTDSNIFAIEQKIETLQSEVQPFLLELLFRELKNDPTECPNCKSGNIVSCKEKNRSRTPKEIKTSFGGSLILKGNLLEKAQCLDCSENFSVIEAMLNLAEIAKYTALTQKKICSANRAGSYENAAKNLKELINLDINRNQVRLVSNHVGDYIANEFKQLGADIAEGLPTELISRRHPLVKKLKIDEKYFDSSNYLIILAVDGGRMQLFNWIPPNSEDEKVKKSLYWHENKVFRISIYDKSKLSDISGSTNSVDGKRKYKSAEIISGSTAFMATNVSWKETAPLISSHLYMRGIKLEDVKLCISDGSEHIMREVFQPLFPKATHILDYYHKNEALHECLKITGSVWEKEEELKNYLWAGDTVELVRGLEEIQSRFGKPGKGKRNPDNPKVKLDNFISHIAQNKDRLNYNSYREQGYPIGSGSIESAVKLFGKRIKGTEKQWNEYGGEAILNLYAFLISEDNRWDKLWETQTPWM